MDCACSEHDQCPFVSVILPAWNEKAWMAACLEALLAQTYPRGRYEVIVVDDGSTDGTPDIVKAYPVTLLHEPARSAYRARNRAIAVAKGDYVAFIDADCIAEPSWLSSLVDAAVGSGSGVLAGRIQYVLEKGGLGNQLMMLRYTPQKLREAVERDHCAPTGNLMVLRDLFERHGVFDPTITGSDDEFSTRLAARGHPPLYVDGATVEHRCDLTNWQYLARTFWLRYGQEIHRCKRGKFRRLANVALHIPWRPGLGHAASVAGEIGGHQGIGFVTLWLYCWLDRILAYVGAVCGCVASLRRSSRRPVEA